MINWKVHQSFCVLFFFFFVKNKIRSQVYVRIFLPKMNIAAFLSVEQMHDAIFENRQQHLFSQHFAIGLEPGPIFVPIKKVEDMITKIGIYFKLSSKMLKLLQTYFL
jgi:hypothetical protein